MLREKQKSCFQVLILETRANVRNCLHLATSPLFQTLCNRYAYKTIIAKIQDLSIKFVAQQRQILDVVADENLHDSFSDSYRIGFLKITSL